LRHYPITQGHWIERLQETMAQKDVSSFCEPQALATIWSAVYVTPGGESVALDFIQQSYQLVRTAESFLEADRPTLTPWVFNRIGHTTFGIGIAESGWFSLVCHMAKMYDELCVFPTWTATNCDIMFDKLSPDNFKEYSRFLGHWDALNPELPPGNYAIMPNADGRVASIEAIELLLTRPARSNSSEWSQDQPSGASRRRNEEESPTGKKAMESLSHERGTSAKSSGQERRAKGLDDLTKSDWKLLKALQQVGGLNADSARSRSQITAKAKTGNHDSKHNQEGFQRLTSLGLICARRNVGTWLTDAGIDALDKRPISG
jgi:hypothetical protein